MPKEVVFGNPNCPVCGATLLEIQYMEHIRKYHPNYDGFAEERKRMEEEYKKEIGWEKPKCQHKWLSYEYTPVNSWYLYEIADGEKVYKSGKGQKLISMICSERGEVKKTEAK